MAKNNGIDALFVRERITELRKLKNVSEYQMSKDLDMSKGYIQRITRGGTLPSLPALFKICDYFGISPKQFFSKAKFPSKSKESAFKETGVKQNSSF